LPRAVDTNLLPAPFTSVTLANGQSISVRNWNTRLPNPLNAAPCAGAAIVNCFVDPNLLQNNRYTSSASAIYHGGIFELKKRFSNHFSLLMNYTYSKAIDNSTDYNSDYEPNDQINLRPERSVSEFDQRHKIVIAGLLESPFKGEGLASAVFGGFTLSPVFRGNTSHPFNLLAGTDVNGDRHSNTDRPIGVPRNTGVGPDFYNFDLGLSRRFHFGHEWTGNLALRPSTCSTARTLPPSITWSAQTTAWSQVRPPIPAELEEYPRACLSPSLRWIPSPDLSASSSSVFASISSCTVRFISTSSLASAKDEVLSFLISAI